MGVRYFPGSRSHSFGAAPADLYSGYGGAAVFLSALWRATGDAAHQRAAIAALAPLRDRIDEVEQSTTLRRNVDVGIATGIGSLVYALTTAGELLGAPDVIEDAARLGHALRPDAIDFRGRLDVASGAAGASLALTALHASTGDAATRDAARAWAAAAAHAQDVPDQPTLLTRLLHGAEGLRLAIDAEAGPARLEPLDAVATDDALGGFGPAAALWMAAGRRAEVLADACRRAEAPVLTLGHGAHDTGLFTGSPGLGLALLHAARPTQIPNVFLWAPSRLA